MPTTSCAGQPKNDESVLPKNTVNRKIRKYSNRERVKKLELNGKTSDEILPDMKKFPEYQLNMLKRYNKENSNNSTIKLRCSYTKVENDVFKVPETPPIPRSSLTQNDRNLLEVPEVSADVNCAQESKITVAGELETPPASQEKPPSPNCYKEEFYKYLGIDTNPCHDKHRKDDDNHSKGKRRSLRVKVQQIAQNNLAKFNKELNNDKVKISEKDISTSSCENSKSCPSVKNTLATELIVEKDNTENVNNDKNNRLNNNKKMKIARGRKPKNDTRNVKINEITEVKTETKLSDNKLDISDNQMEKLDETTAENSIKNEIIDQEDTTHVTVKLSPRSTPVVSPSPIIQSSKPLEPENPQPSAENIKVEVKPEKSLLIVKRSYVSDDKANIVRERSPIGQYKVIILNNTPPNANKLDNQTKDQNRSHVFHRVDYRKSSTTTILDQNAKKLKLSPKDNASDDPDSNKLKVCFILFTF